MFTLCKRLFVCAVLLAVAAPAAAQVRITGGISGAVSDSSGLVVPGAIGRYQVTVTLAGFQIAVITNVVVESSRTTDLRVRLSVGGLEEVVTVEGASPVLERTSNLIASTLNNRALQELPLAGRDVFGLAVLVPGAASPQGGSPHYNGMPGGTINPTIDGVNNSSNGWKSGGTSFFGTVPARLGAIEEVTVETSGQGAEGGAMGGVNLKFVTRRGTSQYRGSGFWQHRNEFFNANSFSNNARNIAKNKLRRHDFGGNFGGSMLPGTALRDKLFVFVNYEQARHCQGRRIRDRSGPDDRADARGPSRSEAVRHGQQHQQPADGRTGMARAAAQ